MKRCEAMPTKKHTKLNKTNKKNESSEVQILFVQHESVHTPMNNDKKKL